MSSRRDIEEIRSKRFQFLLTCYELSGGSELVIFNMDKVGKELGFEPTLTHVITEYLVGERLIKYAALGGAISITHWGIVEVEQALSNPDEPTDHFPALNLIYVGQMIDSQIQQASPAAIQVFIREDRYEQLQEAVNALKESIDQLSLVQQDVCDLKADVQTIEAQMSRSAPNRTIITECVQSIVRILEQATGTVAGGLLLARFNALLGG